MRQVLLRVMLCGSLIVGVIGSQFASTCREIRFESHLDSKQSRTSMNSSGLPLAVSQLGQFDTRQALKDESGTGSEVGRDERNLVINLKPCDRKADYMSFHKPYVEEEAGEMVCDGRVVKLKAVTQR